MKPALQDDRTPSMESAPADLRAFFEISLDLLCVAGFDGFFKLLNPAWERVLGHSRQELYASPFLEFVHPDDRESTAAEASKLADGAATVDFLNRYRHGDGSYRWLNWTASPHQTEGMIYAVARDVTEERRREQDLRASEQRFRTLIHSAPGGILIADRAGSIVLANRLVEEMFGYDLGELVGASVETLLPDSLRAGHRRHREAFSRDPRQRIMSPRGDLVAVRKDGTAFPVAVGLAPLPGEEGDLVAATVTDMTEQQAAERAVIRANDELEARIADLQELGREAELVSEMGELLQASQDESEAHSVITFFMGRLYVRSSGAVGLVDDSRNLVENVVSWGPAPTGEPVFHPGDCWALRRGKPHAAEDGMRLVCPHLQTSEASRSLCVPLLAQGEALGVLSVECADGEDADDSWSRTKRLSSNLADHLGLGLANLRLRTTLQTQSIRDPVTGLFNRRYLEESLEREVARAERRRSSLGVIMLDLDHFKAFNDRHGHRAGDAALVALGSLLRTLVRGEDVPCRYGGEEFALILPDAEVSQVARRADQIREELAHVALTHGGRDLGSVTLSAGVASFPEHGTTAEDLILAADRALYRAKEQGRNRIVVSGETPFGGPGGDQPTAAPSS